MQRVMKKMGQLASFALFLRSAVILVEADTWVSTARQWRNLLIVQ
jgi:hypothetical protein